MVFDRGIDFMKSVVNKERQFKKSLKIPKWVFRTHQLQSVRQYNDQKLRTNNDLQNTTQKTKISSFGM